MSTVLPRIQRVVPQTEAPIWRVPHLVSEAKLHPVVLGSPPDSWLYYPAVPETTGKGLGKWPEHGEFLPRVEEIREIPGVDGTPDPRAAANDALARRTGESRVQALERRGWTIIRPSDPRLPEPTRHWLCQVEGAGGRLNVVSWDVVERVGSRAVWHVDEEERLALLRAIAAILPPMTLDGYERLRAARDRILDRKRAAALKSDLNREAYDRAVAERDQMARTWERYQAEHPPAVVRIRSTRVTA